MRKLGLFSLTGATLLGATQLCLAGGFERGRADIDLLYEPGWFNSRAGVDYIDPKRGFTSINGVAGDYGLYMGHYVVPSFAVKLGDDPAACVGTYVRSFAAEADYTGSLGDALPAPSDAPFGSRSQHMKFDSDEIAATCRVSYDAGRQRFSLLGGIYAEDFDFSAASLAVVPSGQAVPTPFGAAPVYLPAQFDVDADSGFSPGFRAGVAYEIPDIALRAQVLYRSQTTHESPDGSAAGTLSDMPFIVAPGVGRLDVPSPLPLGSPLPIPADFHLDDVRSPQSVSLNLQSGVAAGTLVVASFRWTDWSTNGDLVARIGDSVASITPFRWKDGYTASLGVGHALTDEVSALAAVGFDSGVSTGAETTYTDLYTLSGGLSYKHGIGEARIGGLLGYWTSGEQSVSRGALFNATVGDDWVYALSANLKLSF